MPRMTGGEAFVCSLVQEGVAVNFGLPGIQLFGIIAAIRDEPDIRMITSRSEGATTFMTDGYVRAAGRPGVALVVSGPGIYNAAKGLGTAYSVSSLVVLIAGQIPRDKIGSDTGALHEVSAQIDTIRPVTKWQQISWDQALDEVAGKMKDIIAKYGSEAVGSTTGTGRVNYEFQMMIGSGLK
ncbi:thiamine pyrophosphate-binding protein [Thermodesulfobacteriota bacterium]